MQFVPFGRTGLKVSPIVLGTGGYGARGEDDRVAVGIIHAAIDRGLNVIDTADVYAAGGAEELVGRALQGRRDQVILVTKFWAHLGAGPNDGGVSRRWIMRAVEASLTRLRTDYVDVYMQHRPQLDVELDESLAAMSTLVEQGKVRYIGASTFPAELLVEAEWLADARGRARVVCNEVTYSINVRRNEESVFPTCERFNTAVLAFSPLDSGWLGGRHRRADGVRRDGHWAGIIPSRFDPEQASSIRKLEIVEELVRLADQLNVSLAQLALAWVLEHPAVTAAICGVRTLEQLDDAIVAADLRLPEELLDAIDALVTPGTTVHALDDQWTPPGYVADGYTYPVLPSLTTAARRRSQPGM